MKWILDLEVLPNYFLAGFYCMEDQRVLLFEIYEGQTKARMFAQLKKHLSSMGVFDELITYNGISYDLPVLKKVLEREMTDNEDIYRVSQDVIDGNYRVKSIYSVPHIDIQELLNLNSKDNRVSLKKAAARLGFNKLYDMPHPHSSPLPKDKLKDMRDYWKVDALATAFLREHAGGEIQDRKTLQELFKGDLLTLGRPRVAKQVLNKSYEKYSGKNPYDLYRARYGDDKNSLYKVMSSSTIEGARIVPDIYRFETEEGQRILNLYKNFSRKWWYGTGEETKAHKFNHTIELCGAKFAIGEGGIHDELGHGIYEGTDDMLLLNIDASSFYPMIGQVLGVSPAHLPKMHEVEGKLIDFRLKAKAQKSDPKQARIAASTKIVINSGIFGGFGDMYNPKFDLDGFLAITFNGQLMLLQLVEWLYHRIGGIKVIAANTDGIAVLCPVDRHDKLKTACRYWETHFGIPLEIDRMSKFVKRNANSYLEIGMDGKVIKGVKEFATKREPAKACEDLVINKGLVAYFTEGVAPKDFVESCDNIHDFTHIVSCGRSSTNYFKIDGCDWAKCQKTLRYYKAVNGGMLGRIFPNGKNINSYPHAASVRLALDIPDPHVKNYPDLDKEWYWKKIEQEISKIL